MKNKKGFTLIELLTVIAIIGILAAIIIPAVAKVRSVANDKHKIERYQPRPVERAYQENTVNDSRKTILIDGKEYYLTPKNEN